MAVFQYILHVFSCGIGRRVCGPHTTRIPWLVSKARRRPKGLTVRRMTVRTV